MDYETGSLLLNTIASGAAILWAVGAWFVIRSGHVVAEPAVGTIDIDGDAHDLVRRVAEALTRGSVTTPLQGIVLDEVSKDALIWHGRGGGLRHHGSLRAVASGNRARIAWQVEAQTGLITTGRVIYAFGALAIAALYYLLSTQVLPSENPSVRLQIVQMVHAVHFLWPPFLLGGLARAAKRRLAHEVERVVKNLQFDLGAKV